MSKRCVRLFLVHRFRSDGRGSVAVEFALLMPMLIMLIACTVVYGGWFWTAQSVQSLAAESARAALGGMDRTEQTQLARAFVADHADRVIGLQADKMEVTVETDAHAIEVLIAYDVSEHPIMSLSGLAPAPPSVIRRSAVVRTGGY